MDAAEEFLNNLDVGPESGSVQEWQLMFRLARRLSALPGAANAVLSDYRPAVEAFCEVLRESGEIGRFVDISEEAIEDRWIEFVADLHKVRFPEGMGPLEVAFEEAKRAPITPEPAAIGPDYVLAASTAFYLQIRQGKEELIFLPVERVGRLFGKDKMHGSRLVELLVRYGIIEIVNADFSYTEHKAKTYRFIFDSGRYRGPELPS